MYTIARFRQCPLQCVQTVLGLFGLMNTCVPLAPSYPCSLQFFTSNDQVWSASRIDAATASPVVCAKRANPRNSLCMLQVSSTNRIKLICKAVQYSKRQLLSARVVKKGACSGILLTIWFLKYSIVISIMSF